MSEVAATLGQRLKAERERKGLSAQKAADELHLDRWVIEALENGDFQKMGPAVYGKGHLKRYAELLGLPAAEILDSYDTRSVPQVPAPTTPALRVQSSGPREALGLSWKPIAGVVAIGLAAALLWWRPWHPRTLAAPATDLAQTQAPAPVSSASAPVTPTPPAVVVAQNAADPTAGLGRARLRLSFSADSWVDVHDVMGHRLFAGKGRANSVRTIAGAAPLRVYLGFASGVQVEINNHVVAIGPQFVAGDFARFEAGADGVLRRDAHAASAGIAHPRG